MESSNISSDYIFCLSKKPENPQICHHFFRGLKNTYRPEERLLNLFGENVKHVNRLCCQRQIGARNPLVLSQLGLAALLLLLNVDRDNTQSCSAVSSQS